MVTMGSTVVASVWALLLLPPWLQVAAVSPMSDLDCGEGRVRDLDGSCVEKVVIPSRRRECPDLSVDNGEIFLMGSGRMVQFYCDTGYVKVPDTEIAICQVTGSWSKTVPACLMPGCQVPEPPAGGAVRLLEEHSDTVAEFSCDPGTTLHPPHSAVLGCVDGVRWNSSLVPECRQPITRDTAEAGASSLAAASTSLLLAALLTMLVRS